MKGDCLIFLTYLVSNTVKDIANELVNKLLILFNGSRIYFSTLVSNFKGVLYISNIYWN